MKVMSFIAGGLIAGAVFPCLQSGSSGFARAQLQQEQPDPNGLKAERWYLGGIAALKDTRYKEAVQFFERVLPYKAKHANLYYNLVQACSHLGQWDKVTLYGQGFLFRERGSADAVEVQGLVDKAFKLLADAGRVPVNYTFGVGPDGTEVLINGVPLVNAPRQVVRLIPGKYVVSAPRDGYEPWSEALAVVAGQPDSSVAYTLAALVYRGKVKIASNPGEGVEVFLDDVSLGLTPVADVELDTGRRYLFRFEKPGFDSWVRYIEVFKNDAIELKPVMEKTQPANRVVGAPRTAAMRGP